MATETKTRARPLTAEEFMDLDLGEGMHELVRGELIEVPPPGQEHGVVCGNIALALGGFGKRTGHGYVATNDSGVVTERGPDSVRGADLCYYSNERWPRSRVVRGPAPIPPDLVVEVYSPSDRPARMLEKVREYLDAGVPMVWVVDPARRAIAIYRADDPIPTVLGDGGVIEGLPELPGFRCDVAEFFD